MKFHWTKSSGIWVPIGMQSIKCCTMRVARSRVAVNYPAARQFCWQGRGIVPNPKVETIGEFTFAPWRLGATHDCKRFSLDVENFRQRTFPLCNLIRSVGKVQQPFLRRAECLTNIVAQPF